jgi:hypothetical protein
MSDGHTTERDLEREERRLQRLRLVLVQQPESDRLEEPGDESDPDPREAA